MTNTQKSIVKRLMEEKKVIVQSDYYSRKGHWFIASYTKEADGRDAHVFMPHQDKVNKRTVESLLKQGVLREVYSIGKTILHLELA